MSRSRLLLSAATLLIATGFSPAVHAETVVSLTQLSYDAEDRLHCTAVRMNPAAFNGALPDACTLGPPGGDGPDRITRNTYDAAGELTEVRRAYGTPLEQAYATYTYSASGMQTSVTDANGNKTSFSYDGFDRLTQWNFPDKVTAGVVSATDYETYGYDADGNRTSLRKRDGQTIAYGYDALNRMIVKDVQGTAADVYYGYDLLGAQLYANFAAATGAGISNTYDVFSRLKSTTNDMGTTTRTLAYQYDVAGNRVEITYPDTSYFTYTYDALNRMTNIKEAGSVAIVSRVYDAQGRVGSETRGAVATTLGYDGLSRLTSWTDDLAGTSSDVTSTFAYNSADQVTTKTRSNNTYAFAGYVSVSRPYTANGLNQYNTSGTAVFSYDANGNLISDGLNSYGYDVENRMTSATVGGVAMTVKYDPLGRLWQVKTPTKTSEWTYDGDSLAMEVNGATQYRYIHGPDDDDPMIQYVGAGYTTRYSMESDYQGSIVSLADATGNKFWVNAFDEYGITPNSNYGRFQYTGQAWLAQLGLYYYKSRMYSPTLGRFMQTDPIGYKDQNNLYEYVGNDPMDEKDPTGNSRICIMSVCMITADDYDPQIAPDVTVVASPAIRAAVEAGKGSLETSKRPETVAVTVTDAKGNVVLSPIPGKPGETNQADTVDLKLPRGATSLDHGHIDGRSNGMVDDPDANGGYGDTQTLTSRARIPTATEYNGYIGWHQLQHGQLTFDFPDGAMSKSQMAQIQRNLNREQRRFQGRRVR